MKVKTLCKDGEKVVDLNRRKAIREQCLNCSCWSPKEVANCTFNDCPLYDFRSGEGKQNAKARKKAIRKYCLWCMAGHSSEISKCTSKTCPLFAFRKKALDKSAEIDSLPKKEHIEPLFETKIDYAINDTEI